MGLFSKNNPIQEVRQMKAQGMSDNQIIDTLKSKGFSLPQINDALMQSSVANPDIEMAPPEGMEMQPPAAVPGMEQPEPGMEEFTGRIEEIADRQKRISRLVAEVRFKDDIRKELKEISEEGVTVFFVTHIGEDAEVASRVGLIDKGTIITEGTPEYLKKKSGLLNLISIETSIKNRTVYNTLKMVVKDGKLVETNKSTI